jgi:hypothetical protein
MKVRGQGGWQDGEEEGVGKERMCGRGRREETAR